MLETFLRNHPPTFKGRYDPDGAQTGLKEIERVFRVMQCEDAQKVRLVRTCLPRRLMISGLVFYPFWNKTELRLHGLYSRENSLIGTFQKMFVERKRLSSWSLSKGTCQ